MHEIDYYFSGSGQYSIEGNTYQLSDGCAIAIRAGEVHYPQIDYNDYECVAIHFNPSLFSGIDPEGMLNAIFLDRSLGQRNFYPSPQKEDVHDFLFEYAAAICGRNSPETEADSHTKLRVLCHLPPLLFELRRRFYGAEAEHNEEKPDLVSQTVAFINGHLTESFSLKTIADIFFISEGHLNTKFKKTIGVPIWRYTLSKRLYLTRQRILEGVSPTKAAEQSGWNDYSSFYRQYKAQFGVSPKDISPKSAASTI